MQSGIYEINFTAQTITYLRPMPANVQSIAHDATGRLFGYLAGYMVDLLDGTIIGPTATDLNTLEFHPNGELYGVNGNQIYTIDLTNGVATSVSTMSVSATGLAISPTGQGYVWDSWEGMLYEVDLATGKTTLLDSSTLGSFEDDGSASFGPDGLLHLTTSLGAYWAYNPLTGIVQDRSFFYDSPIGYYANWVGMSIRSATAGPVLYSIAVSPASVYGGSSATGTVTLDATAPAGGASVALYSYSAFASVPASVTIPAGSVSATFTISTTPVTSSQLASILGIYGEARSVGLTILATPNPRISGLSLNPTTVIGGNASIGTVTLTSPAPPGGAMVSVSDNSPYASTPASVTVPAGSTSATFTIGTTPVSGKRTAKITVSYNQSSATATLTIRR